MPSHLANWMKEQRKLIKAEHKFLEDLMNSGALSGLCNYQLVEKERDMKPCKEPMKKGKMPMPKKKK